MKIVSAITVLMLCVGPAGAQKSATTVPGVGSGATPMRPGLWEITVAVETIGSNSKRTIVSRACHTQADVGDIAKVLPRQREPGMKCENQDARVQAANATWRVTCSSGEATLGGSAELALTATTYSGHAELERKKRGARAEKVAETLSGKWLEACK